MRAIRSLRLDEISAEDPASWTGAFVLTFDIDWADDAVLADTVDLVEAAGCAATWFVTHDTPLLDRLRRNPRFELGIHPNFNPLLNGQGAPEDDYRAVIGRLMDLVPEAVSVRSHSVTQNTPITDEFARRGLRFDSNDYIPERAGLALRPWHTRTGMTKVPYCWADEHDWAGRQSSDFRAILSRTGLAVFGFHPIHVFLNTETPDRYEGTRPLHRRPDELIAHRHDGTGARSRLADLMALARGS